MTDSIIKYIIFIQGNTVRIKFIIHHISLFHTHISFNLALHIPIIIHVINNGSTINNIPKIIFNPVVREN